MSENNMTDNFQNLVLKILEQEASEEMKSAKLKILQRMAEEVEVKPSRIPAPANITEVGGYFNLLTKIEKENNDMKMKMIASALGIPV